MTTEERIKIIEERNNRVEAEKAWETSLFRAILIMGLTYIVAYGTLLVIENESPVRNALIPVIGYFLSIQSVPIVKKWWMKNFYKIK